MMQARAVQKRSGFVFLSTDRVTRLVNRQYSLGKICSQISCIQCRCKNGSRDIPFQSQESEQDGRRHFVDF